MVSNQINIKINELEFLNKLVPKNREVIFCCIGTDRSTGDSLGPLVGTQLEKHGYHVVGTVKEPLHALNLEERVLELKDKYPKHFVIAIDACVGSEHDVGEILVQNNGLHPGKALNKNLPIVGDICIKGIVSVSEFLNCTRLYDVISMSDHISIACHEMMLKRSQSFTPINITIQKKNKKLNLFKEWFNFVKI